MAFFYKSSNPVHMQVSLQEVKSKKSKVKNVNSQRSTVNGKQPQGYRKYIINQPRDLQEKYMLTEFVHKEALAALITKKCPSEAASPFIEHFSETTSALPAQRLRFLPNLAFTFRFNLGGTFNLKNRRAHYSGSDHLLVPNKHTWIDEGKFFAIKFRFGLLPSVLHLSGNQYAEQPVSLRPHLCTDYIRSMEHASCFEERIALSENYFLRMYQKHEREVEQFRLVEDMMTSFAFNAGGAKISPGVQTGFVSSRSLQRYFLKSYGLTPKAVYCTLRMRKALETYFSNYSAFSLHDFDYYDYSHFYKEIRNRAGLNLMQLKRDF